MSNLQNITFGDRDTGHLKYSGNWFLTGSYNASSVGQTGTLSSTSDLNAKVTFAFPQPVVAFYYYGIPRCCGGQYGICIDCDPNSPNYITIDAVNRTDDGHNPPVILFSKVFDTPGLHEIIIANENDPRFGKSQLTISAIVLEVEGSVGGSSSLSVTSNAPTSITSNAVSSASGSSLGASAPGSSASGSSTSVPATGISIPGASGSATSSSGSSTSSSPGAALDNNSSSSSHPAIGAIVGGVLAALAFFLIVIILAFWIRLRRRRAAAAVALAGENNNPSIPPSSFIQPFSQYPQSPDMTYSQTATPTTTLSNTNSSPPAVSRGLAVGKHHRPQLAGPFQSISTFSDATGSSVPTSSTPRRELDGGPVYGPVYSEEDTLPPDYGDVFASRRNTTRTVTPNTQAMSETSSSARDGQSNLSPVRRKN